MKNVVFFNLDESRENLFGCYGDKYAYTPNVDKFAEDAFVFENSFAAFPKCTPVRSSFLTGQYPHVGGHRTLPKFEVRKDEYNIVRVFKELGYATAMFGKNDTVEMKDADYFFDEYENTAEIRAFCTERREDETDDELFRAFYRGEITDTEDFCETLSTKSAVDFIERKHDDKFFLMVNLCVPHPPYVDVKPFSDIIKERNIPLPEFEKYEDCPPHLKAHRDIYQLEDMSEDKWRRVVESYYSMVSYSDYLFGMVIDALEKHDLMDDTLIIFTSDHGDFAGEHGCVEKFDTMFYDSLIKIPLIIRDGKNVGRSATLTDTVDLAPTMLEFMNIELPEFFDGNSLKDIVDGKSDFNKPYVFCEGGVEDYALKKAPHFDESKKRKMHPNYLYKQEMIKKYPFTMAKSKMIRNEKWKFIFRVNGINELYYLENDEKEFTNLYGQDGYEKIVMELTTELLKFTINTETKFPVIETMYA